MFHLIKFAIWLAGIAVVAYFTLPYFGYEVNLNYFNESKSVCQQKLNDCSKEFIKQGTQNAKCDLNCVDPKLIIEKQ
ncbi:MAG: hypothetical protein US57_C0003G0030 [Candidatus Moranbacteria bacterium GW2011_GWC2_37_73]|nr:MAG: hypothetical protein UR95_C0003G0029 [Parcubacteria group bacterium GW2011_GWC1_36_108]KKQ01268.1 MAG: hypothetical protein US09_C0001G0028 [Candidatus Moranbacteria bacterium GW2011_GWD1_36_198]KKQ02327.1 MAG: hypothetical protein US10_C0003G0028 [Candidatus Moranbacteria bacterium GW2011_GWD2_36_198]KKQ40222.1 MAG: hypothetical protein US57_C0003G0030 [Candidatus Moranbacteria bacterium GW2011_GWC2_37_73]HAR99722.1 hypothetical protein [Candidatus Moranbacteria bacterium]